MLPFIKRINRGVNQNVERVGRGAYKKLGDRGAFGWTSWPNESEHCNDEGAVRTMIRLKPEELETIAKHIPDAEDACERARTTLSRELSSLAMDLPGVSTPAMEALRDELVHWLRRYEDKLNEAEELLYRTAAAMRQADQTIADNMKEFSLELLDWYDLQRLCGKCRLRFTAASVCRSWIHFRENDTRCYKRALKRNGFFGEPGYRKDNR